jgi:hypothetical protein
MAKGGSDTHTPLPRASAATPPSAASPNETRWGCGLSENRCLNSLVNFISFGLKSNVVSWSLSFGGAT